METPSGASTPLTPASPLNNATDPRLEVLSTLEAVLVAHDSGTLEAPLLAQLVEQLQGVLQRDAQVSMHASRVCKLVEPAVIAGLGSALWCSQVCMA